MLLSFGLVSQVREEEPLSLQRAFAVLSAYTAGASFFGSHYLRKSSLGALANTSYWYVHIQVWIKGRKSKMTPGSKMEQIP